MARVTFQGHSYDAKGRSLLECLTANGHEIPNACRAGICQSCLVRLVKGDPTPESQQGLSPTFVARGLILACQCTPCSDIEVAPADAVLERHQVEVSAIEVLDRDVRALRLRPAAPFDYRAGQFLQLFRDADTMRNYSLASVPGLDCELLLHVGRVPGGQVSGWVFQGLRPGDPVIISEARGDCFYLPEEPDRNLLLIGTGTGLAPLYGIVRDALARGHRGRIELYHGSREQRGQYLTGPLRQLAAQHANFRYLPCVDLDASGAAAARGTVLDCALRDHPDLAGWRVYLCGNPAMVETARLEIFLAGAASSDIHADPFLPTGGPSSPGPGRQAGETRVD